MRLQRLGIETAMNSAAQGVSRRFSIKLRALELRMRLQRVNPYLRFCNKNSWLALLFWLGKPDFEPKLSGKFNIELGNLWDVLWADFVCGGLPFDGAAVLVRGGLLCAEMNLVLDSLRVCKLPCGCRGQVCVALWPAI
ncbi:hypothetical protein DM860_017476 [Cuscuta australis]|uniref:Uncharacterized protein n=1 Tax=Cuscuta australis TaxID=267555 RepID=A0A328DW80_9ASTE|nr:hypothetical protein DM860_017476 [Cuscuta australis]